MSGDHAERAVRRFLTAAAVMAVVVLCLLVVASCGGSDEPPATTHAPDCTAPGANADPQCTYDNPPRPIPASGGGS